MSKQTSPIRKGECPSKLTAAQQQSWYEIQKTLRRRALPLPTWWKVGKLLAGCWKPAAGQKKGPVTMTDLGMSLGRAHSELYYAKQLFEEYGQNELAELEKNDFRWGKMMLTLSVSKSKRTAIIQEAIQQGWSATTLRSEIHRREGYRATPVSRPRKTPSYAGYQEALQELSRQARKWMRYQDNVWDGEEHSMVKDLAAVPTDDLDQKLLQLLQQAKAEVQRVARACSLLEQSLDRTMVKIMAAQASGQPPAQGDP